MRTELRDHTAGIQVGRGYIVARTEIKVKRVPVFWFCLPALPDCQNEMGNPDAGNALSLESHSADSTPDILLPCSWLSVHGVRFCRFSPRCCRAQRCSAFVNSLRAFKMRTAS